jgi:phosphatidylethanolamine-binding protein (PEBP) family uncharacterized protein
MRRSAAGVSLSLLLTGTASAAMSLTSIDIKPGAAISIAHIYPRCGGENISPALSWSGAPSTTKSFVLTMIDIDVKPDKWSHWVVVGLPATVLTELLSKRALDRASLVGLVSASSS